MMEENNINEQVVETNATATENKVEEQVRPQSSKENHAYAEMRRQKEKEQAYLQGQIDAMKYNPYTKEEVKDETDVQILKYMKEAEQKGSSDIVKDGYTAYIKAQKDFNDRATKVSREISELKKEVSPEEVDAVLKDELFRSIFTDDYVNNGGNLKNAYKSFKAIEERAAKKVKDEYDLAETAKRQATNPSSQDGNAKTPKAKVNYESAQEVHEAFERRFGKVQ